MTSVLRSEGMMHGVGWQLVTDVSGQYGGPIFSVQAVSADSACAQRK